LTPYIDVVRTWSADAGIEPDRGFLVYRFSEDMPEPLTLGTGFYSPVPWLIPSVIMVRKSWWDRHTENARLLLVAHEYVHVRFDDDHVEYVDLMYKNINYALDAQAAFVVVLERHKRR
jgi:hypothetical protein